MEKYNKDTINFLENLGLKFLLRYQVFDRMIIELQTSLELKKYIIMEYRKLLKNKFIVTEEIENYPNNEILRN